MLDHQHGIQFMVWPSYGWDSNHVSCLFLGVFIIALLTILGNPGYHVDKPNEIPEDWVDDDAVDDDENRCIDHSGILSIFGM